MDKEILIAYTKASIPSTHHLDFFDEVKTLSESLSCDHRIFISSTQDKNLTPLCLQTRLKMFCNESLIPTNENTSDIFKILSSLEKEGYKKVGVVCEQTQSDLFFDAITQRNGVDYQFESLVVYPLLDPDYIEMTIQNKDQLCLESVSYEEVLSEYNENFNQNLREDYINGTLFNVLDVVENTSTKLPMTIIECASNYVWCVNHNGEKVRAWINDIQKVSNTSLFEDKKFLGSDISDLSEEVLVKVKTNGDIPQIVEAIKNNRVLNAEKVMYVEKLRIATIFAKTMGVADKLIGTGDPAVIVEAGLRKLNNVVLNKDGWKILNSLLAMIKRIGIDYNENMLNASIRHSLGFIHDSADLEHELDKLESDPDVLDKDINKLSSQEIEDMESEILTEDEQLEVFGFDSQLNEVISANERLKRAIRLRARSKQLAIKRKLSYRKYASNAVINRRSRRAAVALIKNKITHGRKNLSISEKIRIESMIKKRAALVDRVAKKLAPQIRKASLARMTEAVDAIVFAKESVANSFVSEYSTLVEDREYLEECIHKILDEISYSLGDDVQKLKEQTVKRFKELLEKGL